MVLYLEAKIKNTLRRVKSSNGCQVKTQFAPSLLVGQEGFPRRDGWFGNNRSKISTLLPIIQALP